MPPLDQTNELIQNRFQDFSNFGSQQFQQFRKFLGSSTPSPGANSFLSLLQAGGGNLGASQAQGQQLQRGAERRRNDFLNTATNQFALGSQSQANQLLGQLSQNQQFMASMAESRRQFDESQPGWLDFIGDLFGFGAGLIPGLGKSGASPSQGGGSLAIPGVPSQSFQGGGSGGVGTGGRFDPLQRF